MLSNVHEGKGESKKYKGYYHHGKGFYSAGSKDAPITHKVHNGQMVRLTKADRQALVKVARKKYGTKTPKAKVRRRTGAPKRLTPAQKARKAEFQKKEMERQKKEKEKFDADFQDTLKRLIAAQAARKAAQGEMDAATEKRNAGVSRKVSLGEKSTTDLAHDVSQAISSKKPEMAKEIMTAVTTRFGRRGKLPILNPDLTGASTDFSMFETIQFSHIRSQIKTGGVDGAYAPQLDTIATFMDAKEMENLPEVSAWTPKEEKMVHALIHETIHSTSPRIIQNDAYNNPFNIVIEESLTEMLARKTMKSVLDDGKYNGGDTYKPYQDFVDAMGLVCEVSQTTPEELFNIQKVGDLYAKVRTMVDETTVHLMQEVMNQDDFLYIADQIHQLGFDSHSMIFMGPMTTVFRYIQDQKKQLPEHELIPPDQVEKIHHMIVDAMNEMARIAFNARQRKAK